MVRIIVHSMKLHFVMFFWFLAVVLSNHTSDNSSNSFPWPVDSDEPVVVSGGGHGGAGYPPHGGGGMSMPFYLYLYRAGGTEDDEVRIVAPKLPKPCPLNGVTPSSGAGGLSFL